MDRKTFLLPLILIAGILIGFSLSASAQEGPHIPNWVKNTAKWWGNGQISDSDFIQALQWLVDNKMIVIPQSQQSSSNALQPSNTGITGMICSRDQVGFIHITGKFTANSSFSFVDLTGAILDNGGNVLATGIDALENVQSGMPKIFDIMISHPGDFSKCEVQVSGTTP